MTGYPPGWSNQVIHRVENLPGPSWVYYLFAWLILCVVETIIKWRDHAYPVGAIFPFHIVFSGFGIYALALMHYLDRVADNAMVDYRAAFKGSEVDFDEVRYRLTHLPFWPTLLASLAGAGLAIPLALAASGSIGELKLATSPLSRVVDGGLFIFQWWVWGALIYHTIWQLQLVNTIYTRFTQLDLFNQKPLYAFSQLAAQTAFGLVFLNLIGDAAAPGAFSQPASIGLTLFLVAVALVTFLWPLMGVHRLLEQEKGKLLGEITQRFLATTAKLHQRIDMDQLSAMDEIEHALASLTQEEKKVAGIPTWPWQADQLRLFVTTILLPIVLWAVQRILGKVIGL